MHPSREKTNIQVGAFVAVGIFLSMLVIFLLGSEKRLFESQYTLNCHFEDISGLRLGAPVQLAGINIGAVNKILFDEEVEEKKVKLVLRLSKSYKDLIREDSEATIVTQGLLGDKMIFISVGGPDKRVLEEEEELTARSPTDFLQLLEEGDDLIRVVKEVAHKVNKILAEVQEGSGVKGRDIVGELREFSRHLNEISSKINRGEGTLGALVNDASVFNDIKTLLGKANRNKLIRAVIRETLRTKEEKILKE